MPQKDLKHPWNWFMFKKWFDWFGFTDYYNICQLLKSFTFSSLTLDSKEKKIMYGKIHHHFTLCLTQDACSVSNVSWVVKLWSWCYQVSNIFQKVKENFNIYHTCTILNWGMLYFIFPTHFCDEHLFNMWWKLCPTILSIVTKDGGTTEDGWDLTLFSKFR